MTQWYLEGFHSKQQTIAKTNISHFPFQIGRVEGLDLTLPSTSVSRIHAELVLKDGRMFVKDYGSTNGTYLNQTRIENEHRVNSGDILQIADCELRLTEKNEASNELNVTTVIEPGMTQHNIFVGARCLDELLEQQLVSTVYQPIVGRDAQTLVGYEILGRGAHPHLSPSPGELFPLAESFDLATNLSETFRNAGVAKASRFSPHCYFLNIHPDELKDTSKLFKSLEKLRYAFPSLKLVLEIHEEAVTNLNIMKLLFKTLSSLDIELAYDDFGAGQGRLLEFVEVPPKIIKFDQCLIKNIDQASQRHIKLLHSLIEIAKDMGTLTLAECVETAAEVELCQKLGMDLFQGYFIDKPLTNPNRH